MDNDIFLSDAPRGYQRSEALQIRFDEAATKLLATDGWRDGQEPPKLVADLALEGGGVKGLGLVGAIMVLDEAGYSFRAVAGTSAGAIAAALVAALSKSGQPMLRLRSLIASLDFLKFMPKDRWRETLERVGGRVGDRIAGGATLTHRKGIFSGDYLTEWLRPILHDELGVKTFGDLCFDPASDPQASVQPGRGYSLVVHTSDLTRGLLVRLPWDYPLYGCDPDTQDPVGAVRASMSIPFFFEPVLMRSKDARVTLPRTGGGETVVHYAAGTQTWVDGGLLENFPIRAFDRVDGNKPRWPTIGIKLSRFQTEFPPLGACNSALAVAKRCVKTLTGEWDSHSVDESTAARTIFVDHAGLNATNFGLTKKQQDQLFLNGVAAATAFVLRSAAANGIPLR